MVADAAKISADVANAVAGDLFERIKDVKEDIQQTQDSVSDSEWNGYRPKDD